MMEEHRAKYAALADELGRKELEQLVAPLMDKVKAALAAGDEHLNRIGLATWDRLAGVGRADGMGAKCAACGQRIYREVGDWPYDDLRASARGGLWSRQRDKSRGLLSLAERVCVLKEVAKALAEGGRP